MRRRKEGKVKKRKQGKKNKKRVRDDEMLKVVD
jgi:hypothetical protein